MQLICSYLDYYYSFLSISIAALLLIINTILQNLSFSSIFRAFTITANSLEYRFYSSLLPSIEEKDKVSFLRSQHADLYILIALPILTILFYTKLLTVIYTAYLIFN